MKPIITEKILDLIADALGYSMLVCAVVILGTITVILTI